MNLAVYRRCSTDEQNQSHLGLEAQASAIFAYMSLYGHKGVGDWVDVASGGKTKGRIGLAAALDAVRRREADGIICSKLDRLTRSVRDLTGILEKCPVIVSVGEQFDSTSASGRLVLTILSAVAEWERLAISERTRSALAVKRERGEKTGGQAPYGWRKGEGGKLICSMVEVDTLGFVKTRRSVGDSWRRISESLNAQGRKIRSGGEWTASSVQRTLARAERIREAIRP